MLSSEASKNVEQCRKKNFVVIFFRVAITKCSCLVLKVLTKIKAFVELEEHPEKSKFSILYFYKVTYDLLS